MLQISKCLRTEPAPEQYARAFAQPKDPPIFLGLLGVVLQAMLLAACTDDCILLDTENGLICGGTETAAIIESAEGLPVVKAMLGDRAIRLLIDTGADTTVISASLVGKPDGTAYRSDSPLCIGEGFCLEQPILYAWDTSFSSPVTGDINGVLGMDMLRYFTLTLHRGESISLQYQKTGCDGTVVPLRYNSNGTPIGSIKIDDIGVEDVLLDTGAAVCLLDETTVNRLDATILDTAVETTGCTATECLDEGVFASTLQTLCIDEHCLPSVPVKFPAWNAVGDSYFFAYDIAFDFVQDTLIFCEDATSP